ncbi:MAG: hypothetical protein QNK17_01765, partial [Hyphomicrobiaceae bacterium]|nr:hypothetical protein [Hyphomicrobiaceae bacterium]MDX2449145.1 hypothetical protein [Hyphomicrobiaceae bacterium]
FASLQAMEYLISAQAVLLCLCRRVASAGGLNASDQHPSQARSGLSDNALCYVTPRSQGGTEVSQEDDETLWSTRFDPTQFDFLT